MQCTHTHFQVQGLEKGVSENEAPGPVGAYTTTHNDTITLMPNLIHRISFTERSPNLIHRTKVQMSHAGCRGYIGRQEHPETQSNTRTYGTKKSSYVHAYIGRDGKWRKRVHTRGGNTENVNHREQGGKKYLTIENGRGGPVATP